MLRVILIIVGIAAVAVGVLGTRGQISSNRPWHVFLDMKYQPRFAAQGQSPFFADGRSSRMPVPGTIPYDGGYRQDVGGPNPQYIPEADIVYYFGRTKPDETKKETVKVPKQRKKLGPDGVPVKDKDGKEVMESYEEDDERDVVVNFFVEHIPRKAIANAAFADGTAAYMKWEALLHRGRERFTIHCAVCHGDTGLGGQGETAHGIVGRKGMIGIASYHQDYLREAPDGHFFDVITNGKNTMPSMKHQVPDAQDRWAIVAYIRALQLSQNAGDRR
jgi:mono/diheme cytochrome c family protein